MFFNPSFHKPIDRIPSQTIVTKVITAISITLLLNLQLLCLTDIGILQQLLQFIEFYTFITGCMQAVILAGDEMI